MLMEEAVFLPKQMCATHYFLFLLSKTVNDDDTQKDAAVSKPFRIKTPVFGE